MGHPTELLGTSVTREWFQMVVTCTYVHREGRIVSKLCSTPEREVLNVKFLNVTIVRVEEPFGMFFYCIVKPGAMPGFSFIEPCALG